MTKALWAIVVLVLPIGVSYSLGNTVEDYSIARLCFWAVSFILGMQAVLWMKKERTMLAYIIVFFACGAIGADALFITRFINEKIEAKVRTNIAQTAKADQLLPLEIIFDPKDSKLDVWIHNEYKGEKVSHHLFRVKIHNRSNNTIEGIQVKLDHTEPNISKFQDLNLHQTGDNPSTFDDYPKWDKYQKEFTLTPRSSQLIDVVYTDSRKPEVSFIQHIVGSVSSDLLTGRYKLFITVSAKDVKPITQVFETEYDAKARKLTFWQQQENGAEGQANTMDCTLE